MIGMIASWTASAWAAWWPLAIAFGVIVSAGAYAAERRSR
jgi:hypothetical protein